MDCDLLLLHLDRGFIMGTPDPVGQLALAAFLKPHGFSVKVFAGDVYAGRALIEGELAGKKNPPLVGLYVHADNLSVSAHLGAALGRLGATVIVGGPQAAFLGEQALRGMGAAYCLPGEAEAGLLQLMQYLLRGRGAPGDIPGLRFFDEQGAYCASPLPPVPLQNLDDIPFTDPGDVLDPAYKSRPYMNMMTGRGCPFHCTFCFEAMGSGGVRYRSVENVLAEIDHVRGYNPALEGVIFGDDTFTLEEGRLRALCEGLRRRGLRFFCEGHVRTLHNRPELLHLMVDCGLVSMQIGIESGSQQVLDAYDKHTTPEQILHVCEEARRAGLLSLQGNFILGGAFETRRTVEESMELCDALLGAGRGMMICSTVYFAPYAGTAIAKDPARFGLCVHPGLEARTLATMFDCVTSTDALSADEIVALRGEFQQRIAQGYKREARRLRAAELAHYCEDPALYQRFNPFWFGAVNAEPHLARFAQSGYGHDDLRPEGVVLRTLPELRYGADGALLCAGSAFEGVEKCFLELACGQKSAGEMAEALGLSWPAFQKLFMELYGRCFAYAAPF